MLCTAEGAGGCHSIPAALTGRPPASLSSLPPSPSRNQHSQAPEDDGGSPVTSYQVQVRPRNSGTRQGDADEWLAVYQGREPACTVGGLRAGGSYLARVVAMSSAGTGTPSAAAVVQTSPSTAGAVAA